MMISKTVVLSLALLFCSRNVTCLRKPTSSSMLSSCICKHKGDIYNLTTLGMSGPNLRPTILSFEDTREVYQYFFNLCYPFSWPPTKRQPKVHGRKSRKFVKLNESVPINDEVDAYPCNNASLCQFDARGRKSFFKPVVARSLVNAKGVLPFFKTITTQAIRNDRLRCVYNKSIDKLQWVYKGVGRIFDSGGMVMTLICDEKVEKLPVVTARYDVQRSKGDPWKFVDVTHKCCCPNKCTMGNDGGAKGSTKKENLYLEIGAAGGGFIVLLILGAIAYRIQQSLYDDQPPISPAVLPQSPKGNYGTFLPKTIPYEEIEHIKQIGEGAFGIVSKARWRNSDVAVKRIKEHVIDEDIEPFIRESIWMSKLPHHNIVQFYGVCVLKPNLCIVTEYMEGGSVADVIHKHQKVLSWKKRIKWATDAAKGMTYLHSQTPPIIHRDLKSDNLLVDENGLVKVGDFGAVKLLEPLFARHVSAGLSDSRRIQSPMLQVNCDTLWAGTLRWSAPEVLPKKQNRKMLKYTPASDIYSFGMTVWELVSNRRPFYDVLWDYQIIQAIENGVRPDVPDECPQMVIDFLSLCWHGNPEVRPTFEDILEKLKIVRMNFEVDRRVGGTWPPLGSQASRQAAVEVLC